MMSSNLKTTILGGVVVLVIGSFIIDPIKNLVIPDGKSDLNISDINTNKGNDSSEVINIMADDEKRKYIVISPNSEDSEFGRFTESKSDEKTIMSFQKNISLDNQVSSDFGKFKDGKNKQDIIPALDNSPIK